MSYIQSPGFARKALALAIAALAPPVLAQEVPYEPTDIADPIVVTATRMPTRYNKLISDVTVVDQETIRDYSPAEPITDILANQPGITVRSNGGIGTNATVQIRGASNAQTILLVDGLRLNSATTGAPPWASAADAGTISSRAWPRTRRSTVMRTIIIAAAPPCPSCQKSKSLV